jgi:hypothetical protein
MKRKDKLEENIRKIQELRERELGIIGRIRLGYIIIRTYLMIEDGLGYYMFVSDVIRDTPKSERLLSFLA